MHPMLGLLLKEEDGGLLCLKDIAQGMASVQLKRWRSRLRHGYLREVNGETVQRVDDVKEAVWKARASGQGTVALTFTHCEVPLGITSAGIPQLSMDQLNTIRHHLAEVRRDGPATGGGTAQPTQPAVTRTRIKLWHVSGVQAVVRSVHDQLHAEIVRTERAARREKLTRRKLLLHDNWGDWKRSEFKQLDQYNAQGMFREPVPPPKDASIFHFIWTYVVKTDGMKNACCVCDGSPRAGQARVLDHTYASCVVQIGGRIFYACCALEGLKVFGVDVRKHL